LRELAPLLIVIVSLSGVMLGFSVSVPPLHSLGTFNQPFNQPLQVWANSLLSISSGPNATCESVVNPNSSSSFNLPLENGLAQPNLWGLNSATGIVQQCYGTNGLQTSIRLTAIKSKVTKPLGYPEVIYGNNLYDYAMSSGSVNQPAFPRR